MSEIKTINRVWYNKTDTRFPTSVDDINTSELEGRISNIVIDELYGLRGNVSKFRGDIASFRLFKHFDLDIIANKFDNLEQFKIYTVLDKVTVILNHIVNIGLYPTEKLMDVYAAIYSLYYIYKEEINKDIVAYDLFLNVQENDIRIDAIRQDPTRSVFTLRAALIDRKCYRWNLITSGGGTDSLKKKINDLMTNILSIIINRNITFTDSDQMFFKYV